MGHPRWPGFDHKTGNPIEDNRARNMNRRMWRDAKRALHVSAAGRRRRKYIKRVEGATYIKIVVHVMDELARRDAS